MRMNLLFFINHLQTLATSATTNGGYLLSFMESLIDSMTIQDFRNGEKKNIAYFSSDSSFLRQSFTSRYDKTNSLIDFIKHRTWINESRYDYT